MRIFSIAALLTLFGISMGAALMNESLANAWAQTQEFHPPSIATDTLATGAKNLPLR
jgi:hypothetical protein